MKRVALLLFVLVLSLSAVLAQRRFRSYGPIGWQGSDGSHLIQTEGGVLVNEDTVRTAREIASHSTGTPEWTNTPGFENDVYTFVRIIRDRDPYSCPSAGPWIIDFPDSDLNFSFRLQQVTSIKTDPDGRVLRLTDPDLCRYPWIYMVEPGGLLLRDEEVPILRNYLLNGGVLWADDFWGEWQWETFEREMKRVFPGREFVELPMTHPIFHSVFDLKVQKKELQTPASGYAIRNRGSGITWEVHQRPDGSWEQCSEMHVRAICDDRNRILVLATHNCDNGDSWEREGQDEWFFHEFCEKRGYPLGINVIFYLMTH